MHVDVVVVLAAVVVGGVGVVVISEILPGCLPVARTC
jgi:hypothetical protein